MRGISIIYWSGTGNTQMMANAISEGIQDVQVKLVEVKDAQIDDVLLADGIALGCPSMGAEVLEEDEMEPFISRLEEEDLNNKPMILFGSYGWGDGEWMRDWEERMKKSGANLIESGYIVQEVPEEDNLSELKALGAKLAKVMK